MKVKPLLLHVCISTLPFLSCGVPTKTPISSTSKEEVLEKYRLTEVRDVQGKNHPEFIEGENCKSVLKIQESIAHQAPKAFSYVQETLDFIIKGNKEHVGEGFNVNRLCVGITNDGIAADAEVSYGGALFVNLGSFLYPGIERSLPGILAHEVAHLTMKHAFPSQIHPHFSRSKKWQKALKKFKSDGDHEALNEVKYEIEEQLPESISNNWIEEEADLVGLYYLLNAGRPLEDASVSKWDELNVTTLYGSHFALPYNKNEADLCRQIIKSGDVIPPRGEESHPSSCWRIHNIEVMLKNLYLQRSPHLLQQDPASIKHRYSFQEVGEEAAQLMGYENLESAKKVYTDLIKTIKNGGFKLD